MVAQHFRWDFVGLSTDTKPTPETSEKVVDGSTFYCSDTSKLYVFCKDDWYERKPLGGGGGGTTYTAGDGITIADDTISVDLAQTTGSSTTKVMSQKATTDFVSGLIKAGSAPTTSTEGTLGQLYEDTTNGKLYQCTAIAGDTYTWTEIGAGGGSSAVTELTTDDYDYNYLSEQAPDGVALWRLPAGLYHSSNDVQTYAGADSDFRLSLNSHFIIIDDDGSQKLIKVIGDSFTASSNGIYKGFVEYSIRASDGYGTLAQSSTSVVTSQSLMIRQGRTPSSSDIGYLGQLWYDNANNKLYINVNRPADYSGNWKEITLS